jgi:myo-inositol-1-phosphate synthase
MPNSKRINPNILLVSHMRRAEIKVAVIGAGNVGLTFIRGIDYYTNSKNAIGLWHQEVAGFKPSHIKVTAIFDIDPDKVDRSLSDVTDNDLNEYPPGRNSAVKIHPGILSDNKTRIDKPITTSTDDVVKELQRSRADIVLNLISSGQDETSRQYAKAALKAKVAFVNATPSKIATSPLIAQKFAQNKLVLAGDDLLSQFGGTAFHKGMIDFMVERGIHVKKSYQLDVGGSSETKNTMDERIRMTKRLLKTDSIGMEAPYKFQSVAGTTEYTDFLANSRNSYYWMSSEGFLGSNIVMDLTLRSNDGANAGNVLLDVVRAIGGVKKSKISRASEIICAYGFKNPPTQYRIRDSYANFIKMFG